jgi:cell division protein FtsL
VSQVAADPRDIREAAPDPVRAPSPQPVRPERTPAARPTTSSPPQSYKRARRGSTPVFWLFTALIVSGMVVGIVSLSALIVQSSFRIDDLQARIAGLSDHQETLTERLAAASSPGRVQAWARTHDMVMPEHVVVLRVPAPPPEESA